VGVGQREVTSRRLHELLDALRGRRIVVVGDVMLDRYLLGDSDRISPEAPVPVVTIRERRLSPGGAGNVAANVVALGAAVTLVGVVGDDLHAEALREALRMGGITDDGLVTDPTRPTTAKTRVFAGQQQVVRIDEEADAYVDEALLTRLTALAREAIAQADALLFEDYDKGTLTRQLIRDLTDAARARDIPIVADPKHRGFFDYPGITLLKPNRREFAQGLPGLDLDSAEDLERARARLECEHLLVTRGAEGMVLVSRGLGVPRRIPSGAREIFDVSGAGDTVTAWAGTALAAGATAVEAAELANLAAGIEVGKAGVAVVSAEEVALAHRR
jgi:D-beta-D-heptose 7-phosphate kinase/D-beta-D-heptose 1-phosphate adenosyltransferase